MHQPGPATLSGLCQITDQLYLSNSKAANDGSLVSRFNITCIINVSETRSSSTLAPGLEYIHIPIPDSPRSPVSDHFDEVADKIALTGEQDGRTLLHCNAGVSRSATLCIAYLMKHRGMTLLEAYRWVRSCRPMVRPNVGFWRQLIRYEGELRGCSTVRMVCSSMGEIPDIYEEEARNMLPL
ncbi:dual specificity protein phosphatase 18 [Myripristis murdjan]|uniref:dual specificity protein phosphatase 18 n=1 Tax=Myripristis murdjan TaxID=586833 RepID=UPI0011761E8B|nr:dual specificity protein phosphatase 18-like [Myripristis murdjan]